MLIAAFVAGLAAPGLFIQSARVDITPPEPLPLGGYTARQGKLMAPGGKPLYARCLAFECAKNNLRLAVVSAEMLTIPHSLQREVEKRIPKGVDLFLAATHTHSAPDSQMLNDRMTFAIPGIASFKRRWLDWYSAKIASCVQKALASPPQVCKGLSVAEFHLALNRGRRKGADPETLATVLQAHVAAKAPGKTEALLAEYAAHPVFYGPENNQTNGDWPAFLSDRLAGQEAANEGARSPFPIPLVLVGALGDVSPHAQGPTPQAQIEDFVGRFMQAYNRAITRQSEVWSPGGKLGVVRQPIRLEPLAVHPDFVKDYNVPLALAQVLIKKFAPETAEISAFRLGALAVIGVPGEPTSHLGRRIREAGMAMGFHGVLVLSHVNGWIGYLLDAQDYANGGYEATLSFYGPNEGDDVVNAAVEALKKLRQS